MRDNREDMLETVGKEVVGEEAAPKKHWSRAERRRMGVRRAGSSVPGRMPRTLPRKTGQDPWFREASEQHAIKAAQQRISTARLSSHLGEVALRLAEHFPTLWDLTQANKTAVLAVPTVGPAAAKRIRQYLIEHNAEPRWNA